MSDSQLSTSEVGGVGVEDFGVTTANTAENDIDGTSTSAHPESGCAGVGGGASSYENVRAFNIISSLAQKIAVKMYTRVPEMNMNGFRNDVGKISGSNTTSRSDEPGADPSPSSIQDPRSPSTNKNFNNHQGTSPTGSSESGGVIGSLIATAGVENTIGNAETNSHSEVVVVQDEAELDSSKYISQNNPNHPAAAQTTLEIESSNLEVESGYSAPEHRDDEQTSVEAETEVYSTPESQGIQLTLPLHSEDKCPAAASSPLAVTERTIITGSDKSNIEGMEDDLDTSGSFLYVIKELNDLLFELPSTVIDDDYFVSAEESSSSASPSAGRTESLEVRTEQVGQIEEEQIQVKDYGECSKPTYSEPVASFSSKRSRSKKGKKYEPVPGKLKLFICAQCSEAYKSSRRLKSHKSVNHPFSTVASLDRVPPNSTELEFERHVHKIVEQLVHEGKCYRCDDRVDEDCDKRRAHVLRKHMKYVVRKFCSEKRAGNAD